MKPCTACKAAKPLTEFHRRAAAKDGLQSICKDCNRRQRNAYYKTAHGRDLAIVTGKKWRVRNTKHLYDYLCGHPCLDCGEADPVVLEFDHLRDKLFNINEAVRRGYGWQRVLDEIAKCEVVCRNCHARRTARRGGWAKLLLSTR